MVDGGSSLCHEQEVGGGGWWMVRGVPCGSLLCCITSSWSSCRIIELRWLGSAMKNKKIKLKKHTIGPNDAFLMHHLGHGYIGGGGSWSAGRLTVNRSFFFSVGVMV